MPRCRMMKRGTAKARSLGDTILEHASAQHLPSYITAPGETDVLYLVVGFALVVVVFLLGAFYFWLHSLPERMAHGASRQQLQLVAILAVLALFTHNNAFWVAALLLAAVPLPDVMGPMRSIADSLAKIATDRDQSSRRDGERR